MSQRREFIWGDGQDVERTPRFTVIEEPAAQEAPQDPPQEPPQEHPKRRPKRHQNQGKTMTNPGHGAKTEDKPRRWRAKGAGTEPKANRKRTQREF